MPDLSLAQITRYLVVLAGWLLLLGLLAACYWAYLQPDFLLDLISGNFMC